MQAIVETLFDAVYLISVITIGILMIRKSKGNRQFTIDRKSTRLNSSHIL